MAFLKREGTHIRCSRAGSHLAGFESPQNGRSRGLAQIKEDASLKLIPVVILTTSEAEWDIVNSYQLQANCYL